MEKYCTAGQSIDGIMVHLHCMLDTQGYKHTLRLCSTRCFSTATMFGGTRLKLCCTFTAGLVAPVFAFLSGLL
jgi:hypothetical protein